MPNFAWACCCACPVPIGEECNDCNAEGDYTPTSFKAVVAGITFPCVDMTTDPMFPASTKAGDVNGEYCLEHADIEDLGEGKCYWYYYLVNPDRLVLANDAHSYADDSCTGATEHWQHEYLPAGGGVGPTVGGEWTSELVIKLVRIDGGWDVYAWQTLDYIQIADYGGSGQHVISSGSSQLFVFAGRVMAATCTEGFVVTNGSHPDFNPSTPFGAGGPRYWFGTGGTITFTPCCLPTPGTCFQKWTATWDCDTETWGTRIPGEKACYPAGILASDWTKSGSDATTCTYQIFVDTEVECNEDGDCSEIADTDPPDLPFGGGPPDDCCPCPVECRSDYPCEDCVSLGEETPTWIYLHFSTSLHGSYKCLFGDGNRIYRVKTNFPEGNMVLFTQDPTRPCIYVADMTGMILITECLGDGSAPCGGCAAEDGDSVGFRCTAEYQMGGLVFYIEIPADPGTFGGDPDTNVVMDVTIQIDWIGRPSCCESFTYNVPEPTYNEIIDPGWNSVVGPGEILYVPCYEAPIPPSDDDFDDIYGLGLGEPV